MLLDQIIMKLNIKTLQITLMIKIMMIKIIIFLIVIKKLLYNLTSTLKNNLKSPFVIFKIFLSPISYFLTKYIITLINKNMAL